MRAVWMMMLFAFFLPLWPTKLLGDKAFKVGKIPEFLYLNPLLTAWNSLTFVSGKLRRCFSLTSLSLFPEGKQPQMLVVRVPTLFFSSSRNLPTFADGFNGFTWLCCLTWYWFLSSDNLRFWMLFGCYRTQGPGTSLVYLYSLNLGQDPSGLHLFTV